MTRTEQESRRRETIYESMYCALPLPKDQFSHETSTRLMSRSSGRSPGDSDKISAIRLKSARFCWGLRPVLNVGCANTTPSERETLR